MPEDKSIELSLDLRRHCIETAIRRCYDQALGTYFKQSGEERERLEKDIELLLQALETLDFPTLRGRHRALAGATASRVALSKDHSGRLVIQIDDQALPDLPTR